MNNSIFQETEKNRSELLIYWNKPLFGNETKPQHDLSNIVDYGNNNVFVQYTDAQINFGIVSYISFAIFGVIGNLISIIALSKSKRLRNATTAFVINLCVSDLLLCSFSLPFSSVTFIERGWNYGDTLCTLLPMVRYSNGAVSIFSVVSITLNRYVLVAHPRQYSKLYKPRYIALMIITIWITSIIFLIPPLFEAWGKYDYDPTVGTCSIIKVNGKSPKTFLYLFAFGLMSVVFILCYIRIFWVVHRASKKIQNELQMSSSTATISSFSPKLYRLRNFHRHSGVHLDRSFWKRDNKELRVLKVMLVIFITFLICFLPVSIVKIFRDEDEISILNLVGYLGVYFSSIINPVIYVVTSREYRKAYIELFCKRK
ncbi:G-protein coupled receptor moody, partial [Stegodyphus mimosarum]